MRRNLAGGMPAATAAELACAARLTVGVGGDTAIAAHEIDAAHRDLRAALDRFEETPAQRVLERLLAAHSRPAVIRDVVLPYLRELGDRWARGEVTVAQEHFTSTFVEARLMAMARGWDRGAGPRALLACPAGERHTFGLIAFGIALHEHGWRIVYLGADTPAAMVGSAAAAVEPELVVLAAVSLERFVDEADQLAPLAARWRCALAGAGAMAEGSTRIGAARVEDDPISAAEAIAD